MGRDREVNIFTKCQKRASLALKRNVSASNSQTDLAIVTKDVPPSLQKNTASLGSSGWLAWLAISNCFLRWEKAGST